MTQTIIYNDTEGGEDWIDLNLNQNFNDMNKKIHDS